MKSSKKQIEKKLLLILEFYELCFVWKHEMGSESVVVFADNNRTFNNYTIARMLPSGECLLPSSLENKILSSCRYIFETILLFNHYCMSSETVLWGLPTRIQLWDI